MSKTFEGRVRSGRIIIEGDVTLPEGARVTVHVLGEGNAEAAREAVLGLRQPRPALPDEAFDRDSLWGERSCGS